MVWVKKAWSLVRTEARMTGTVVIMVWGMKKRTGVGGGLQGVGRRGVGLV